MPTIEILKTYSVLELKREIGKARMKNYSKLKKAEVMDLMMKNKEKFHHLKGKVKAVAKPKAEAKPKAVAKVKAVAKPTAKKKASGGAKANKEPAHLPKTAMDKIKGFANVGKDVKKKAYIPVQKAPTEDEIKAYDKRLKNTDKYWTGFVLRGRRRERGILAYYKTFNEAVADMTKRVKNYTQGYGVEAKGDPKILKGFKLNQIYKIGDGRWRENEDISLFSMPPWNETSDGANAGPDDFKDKINTLNYRYILPMGGRAGNKLYTEGPNKFDVHIGHLEDRHGRPRKMEWLEPNKKIIDPKTHSTKK